MTRTITINKKVGQTPLQALENYRSEHKELANTSMAYAGRLDPMASGKLLVLVGDECKKQKEYHGLDKEYYFFVLLGVESDTGDVLGRLNSQGEFNPVTDKEFKRVAKKISGSKIKLPYPKFSSKTVQGKPLHTWTLEDRLEEIEIPTNETQIHQLEFLQKEIHSFADLADKALLKIDTIPEVTEKSKELGRDFRRSEVREDWNELKTQYGERKVIVAQFKCIASSGSYMRSLSEYIGKQLDSKGLAWHIHRSKIGKYQNLPFFNSGFWLKNY